MATLKVEIALVGDAIATDGPGEVARMFKKVTDHFSDIDSVWSHMALFDTNGNRCGEVWVEED